MLNHQGNQDFVPIDRLVSEPCTLHLPQIAEPVSVQKFLDRIMQYQVDPAQVGRQICQIIATNSDREILLLQIANTLGVALQAEWCLVTAVTDNQVATPHGCWQSRSDRPDSSDIVADLAKTPEFSQTTILNSPLISPILAKVLAEGELAGISDIQDSPVANVPNSLMAPLPFRAILVAPVRFGAAINGIIMLGKLQPYEWSAADRQQLELVSDSISIAISQIHKTQEITTLNQHLQQQAKYQNLLRRVASSIDTSSEIEQILQRIIENTAHTLEVDRGKILLLKYTDPLFQTRSPNQTPRAKVELVCETPQRKRPTTRTKNKYFWISESSLFDRAFNNAPQSLALADTGEFIHKEHPKATEILNLEGTRSLLMLPLLGASGHGTVLGFLVLQHSEPRTWEQEELEVVESVAAQITTAIIQTQTLKQIQALVEDRTSQLQRSLEVQAILYEQTRRQVEQLRRLNQLKDEFVATMSDALRNPLASMKLAIQMLKTANLIPKHQSYLEILETECIRETALINDLLALQELEARLTPFPVAEIKLERLIQDVVQEFDRQLLDNRRLADRGLTLKVDLPNPSPCLETHSESLKRVLLELLTNAGTFSVAGTAVVLDVSQAAGYIVLSVSNFGRGIFDVDLPHIFEKFRRGTGVTEQGIVGTGLGLALVKCLVQHLNGTIDVSSSPSDSSEANDLWRTCFTLTLPQFQEEISHLEE
jgi:signal transduction histidine kinase